MNDTVSVTMPVEFAPFKVPSFARMMIDEATKDDDRPAIRVADLPNDALDALAARWLDSLYANQARSSPWSLSSKSQSA